MENTDSILFSQATHTTSLRRQRGDRCQEGQMLWQRQQPQDAEPSLSLHLSLRACSSSRRGRDRACHEDWSRAQQQG